MADRTVDHLLIGGGLAAGNTARHLRENSDDSILLVGRETEPPYNRPPLTKDYLSREKEREMDPFRPSEFWDEQRIDLLTGVEVTELDPEAHEATLSDGTVVGWGKVLVATGANVNQLKVEGSELAGIHSLRQFGDSDAILDDLAGNGSRVTTIGGSFIGCEVAATLSRRDCECQVVMPEQLPLARVLGEEIGTWTQRRLEGLGVQLNAEQRLSHFEGENGRVARVVCESGLTIDTDLVVLGIGVHPETTLAERAGLEIGEGRGIVTDAGLRTSARDVFAAGDVAEWWSAVHQKHIRVEHWDVALHHGRTAALNMLGGDFAHSEIPYFWSDLADVEIESVGPAYGWDRLVMRGSIDDAGFSVWYVQDGRLMQVAAVERGDDLDVARKLIGERIPLSDEQVDRLADLDFDPATLA